MKFLNRGLYALLLTIFLQSQLSAEYLYKDDLTNNSQFKSEIEALGSELYEKTGISLRLNMFKALPNALDIVEYEKIVLKEFSEPTIMLTFSEAEKNVNITVNDPSLYKYFNKKQVLSPVASSAQAIVMSVIFARSLDEAGEFISNSGGTILPLLGNKTKGSQLGKYSAAMYNGYLDIAMQIANSKKVDLENGVGDSSKYPLIIVKVVFYLLLVYAMFLYIRNKIYKRRAENESK